MTTDLHVLQQIRNQFYDATSNRNQYDFHENDLKRIETSDSFLVRCYEHKNKDVHLTVKMLIETCQWRKSFGVHDLNENTLSKDLLDLGQIFPRNRDRDGCTLIVFRSYLHKSSNTEGLKKILVYWLEKVDRDDDGKAVSLFFDQQNSGLSNIDLDFLMKFIFPLFDYYYPCFLNKIFIYELPWISTGALKIVKNLLHDQFRKKLTTITKSNINEYISRENCLTYWNNGLDNYEFKFVPETTTSAISHDDNDITQKKVFILLSNNDRPLTISPKYVLKFENENEKYIGKVMLSNSSNKTVVFKIKTTSPEKFRVSPGIGSIEPGKSHRIAITLAQGYYLKQDKFLILSTISENLFVNAADVWKNSKNQKIFEHRITCEPMNNICKNGLPAPQNTNSNEIDTFHKSTLDQLNAISKTCQELDYTMNHRVSRLEHAMVILCILLAAYILFWPAISNNWSVNNMASTLSDSCPSNGIP